MLETVDELMHADGVVHANEQRFRDELFALLSEPIELDELEIEPIPEGAVVIGERRALPPQTLNHPFLQRFEWNYAADANVFAKQAEADIGAHPKIYQEARRAARPGRVGCRARRTLPISPAASPS